MITRAHVFSVVMSWSIACLGFPLTGAAAGEPWDKLVDRIHQLYETERYDEAWAAADEALAFAQDAFGPEHTNTAAALNNLGVIHRAQGRYTEAEEAFLKALEIDEKALGPEHPDLAASLSNLGGVYYAEQKYLLAESLLKRALHVLEPQAADHRPELVECLSNLADVYAAQGRENEAEQLYRRPCRWRRRSTAPTIPPSWSR